MRYINLTPHEISVYGQGSFVGLNQIGRSDWVADGVSGQPIAKISSDGIARIDAIEESASNSVFGSILSVRTVYGDLSGIPDNVGSQDILIVSMPTAMNAAAVKHIRSRQMVTPWRVVKLRGPNGKPSSTVLGCMGFSSVSFPHLTEVIPG